MAAASSFMATSARTLDRRRFAWQVGDGSADAVVAALDAYRNPDGGYGWGLEPDLRDSRSQPACAMHALEVLGELGVVVPQAAALCDWLGTVTLPDGGLPMALPVADPAGCAHWWLGEDAATASSLQMTAQVAAAAHVVARHDPAVRDHPWLARATGWCFDAARNLPAEPHAYELLFTIRFLDAVEDEALLREVGAHLPPDGRLPVAGGVEGEVLHPLDIAPHPDRPARSLLADDVIAADLARLEDGQQPDGGWTVDFPSSTPAGALEWRGIATARAVAILR